MPTQTTSPTMHKTTIHTAHGTADVDAASFMPDWTHRGTLQDLQAQVSEQLRLPGWYITRGERDGKKYKDATLLIPMQQVNETGAQLFYLCVWNHHTAYDAIDWMSNAPVHLDEREEASYEIDDAP